eukprot:TRINITY_DN2376_c0_g1_i1.p1 TRINITY_DN2376_c0_g1~~TRINITY_DN2376_c0_g1_i1.p1  ORF type:complete len:767 (+),score=201.43 TRINITY_DN2376_c0_g1_i1:2457-4757(+)
MIALMRAAPDSVAPVLKTTVRDEDGVKFRHTTDDPEAAPAPQDADDDLANVALTSIGQESDDGNIEYKLKLVAPSEERFQGLVSQLKYRLAEGQGEAFYEVGVSDSGLLLGLSAQEFEASLATLKRMAAALNAETSIVHQRSGKDGSVAEVLIRAKPEEEGTFLDIRIAVAGNVDSGKSTLIGVLTRGALDNGRGSARLNVFRHKHEAANGRTSAISHQILGFDSKGECINYRDTVRPPTWTEVVSESYKLLSFIDLCGHDKYLKTTVFGLCQRPDYALLMVGANMGVTRMTKEHLGIALALKVPVVVCVTKIDICPPQVLKETLDHLQRLLKSPGARKLPLIVRNIEDILLCTKNIVTERFAPIFMMSNVTGEGLDLFRTFLNLLPPSSNWESTELPALFQIDETYNVTGVGTVVAGTLVSGVVSVNDTLLLGPDSTGKFTPTVVKSIHNKRIPVRRVTAGHSATFGLKKIKRSAIRKGMIMADPALRPVSVWEFTAEVLILHHPTTIHINYQPVIHCSAVRQAARILSMDAELLRTGDRANVRFRFLYRSEFLRVGDRVIFREGRTKGIGKIVALHPPLAPTGSAAAASSATTTPVTTTVPLSFPANAATPAASEPSSPIVPGTPNPLDGVPEGGQVTSVAALMASLSVIPTLEHQSQLQVESIAPIAPVMAAAPTPAPASAPPAQPTPTPAPAPAARSSVPQVKPIPKPAAPVPAPTPAAAPSSSAKPAGATAAKPAAPIQQTQPKPAQTQQPKPSGSQRRRK